MRLARFFTLLLLSGLLLTASSCGTQTRGYNYKAHAKRNKKMGRKKAPSDLTKVKCPKSIRQKRK